MTDETLRTPRFAVLPPFVSQWLLNRLEGGATFRAGQAWALQQGHPELARDLGHAFAQLQASAEYFEPPPSAGGSAEVPSMGERADSECPPRDWWPTRKVAVELRVSSRQVRYLIEQERLTATLVGGRWLVDPKSVADYNKVIRRPA